MKERKNKKLVYCPLWVLKRCPLPIFRAQAWFIGRHLKVSLCDLLYIFWYQNTICRQIHWILQYSFIAFPGQRWMERKEAVRLCLFVCFFVLSWKINQPRRIWFCRVSVILVSCLESETGRGGLCGSPCLTGIATAAPIKVLVPLLGYYLILRNSKFFIYFL